MNDRKTGFVLVSVLFISMALLTGVTGLAWYARNQMMRVQCELELFRARTLAFALVSQISRGLVLDDNGYDHMDEEWFGRHVVPVENRAPVVVELRPLDDMIPIACLFLPDGATLRAELEFAWERSLSFLDLDNMGEAILDYMDVDTIPRIGGVDSDKMPNRPIWSLYELRACPGFPSPAGERFLDPIREEIFTVWSEGRININVAPEKVLVLLDPEMGRVEVERLLALREESPFQGNADLADRAPFLKEAIPRLMNLVDFRSSFFEARLAVPCDGDRVFRFRVILHKTVDECDLVRWEES